MLETDDTGNVGGERPRWLRHSFLPASCTAASLAGHKLGPSSQKLGESVIPATFGFLDSVAVLNRGSHLAILPRMP